MSWSTLSQPSTHYQLTVDRMSFKCQSRCSSSVHWVSMKYQSHVDKDNDWESIEGMDRHSTIDMTWSSGILKTCPPYHLGISLKTIKWKPENESGSFIVLTELFFFFFFLSVSIFRRSVNGITMGSVLSRNPVCVHYSPIIRKLKLIYKA